MDCKNCIDNLTAYLDGELLPEDDSQIRLHLASCAPCSRELQGFRQASDFMASNARELNLSPGSWSRVQAQISARKPGSFFRLPIPVRWQIPAAAFACLVLITSGFLWYQQARENSLNAYIAQYEKAREAGRFIRRAAADINSGLGSDVYTIENPFVEAKVGLDLNPFRSEDR